MTERFTIGQMAEVNHVTKKTLMLYHKHGLLVPEDVDPQTGYRYYTLEQCSTLDMIQQLKQVGLSLAQIRDVMDKKDVAYMQSLIREQITRMRREMTGLELSLSTARSLVGTCDTYLSKPKCYDITLEYIPRRRVLYYEVTPYVVQKQWVENPGLSNWERACAPSSSSCLRRGIRWCCSTTWAAWSARNRWRTATSSAREATSSAPPRSAGAKYGWTADTACAPRSTRRLTKTAGILKTSG